MGEALLTRDPYIKQVGSHFLDLPWAERKRLLDVVAARLDGVELDRDDVEAWVERFGPPAEYARQVRAEQGHKADAAARFSLHRDAAGLELPLRQRPC